MSDSETPSDIENAAEAALSTLIPEKSKGIYLRTYEKFEDWCKRKKVHNVSEKVMLAYFSEISLNYKSSTLWSHYSMLRTTIYLNKNIDISKFTNVVAFLKRKREGYRPKKSKIFSKQEIERFIKEANDETYLMMKVVLIVALSGACRREELTFMGVDAIEDAGTFIKVNIPDTKTKIPRLFTITEGDIDGINFLSIFRKYANLRPQHTTHNRFFVFYKNLKCTVQPVGINTIGCIPMKIANFLGLPNSKEYTGHAFRRTSASFLADAGANLSMLKRHGGWRSNSVAEGYVENSLENKKSIARKILGDRNFKKPKLEEAKSATSLVSSEDQILSTSHTELYERKEISLSSSSRIHISNLHNCTINITEK